MAQAILSLGPSYDTAQPVAYNSCTSNGVELNYPVHEKETLVVVRATKKFHANSTPRMPNIWEKNRFWFINNKLFIPNAKDSQNPFSRRT